MHFEEDSNNVPQILNSTAQRRPEQYQSDRLSLQDDFFPLHPDRIPGFLSDPFLPPYSESHKSSMQPARHQGAFTAFAAPGMGLGLSFLDQDFGPCKRESEDLFRDQPVGMPGGGRHGMMGEDPYCGGMQYQRPSMLATSQGVHAGSLMFREQAESQLSPESLLFSNSRPAVGPANIFHTSNFSGSESFYGKPYIPNPLVDRRTSQPILPFPLENPGKAEGIPYADDNMRGCSMPKLAVTSPPYSTFSIPLQRLSEPVPEAAFSIPKIGRLSAEERRQKIEKYRTKRYKRVWKKKINYTCRKRVADQRVRIKGRFISKTEAQKLRTETPTRREEEQQREPSQMPKPTLPVPASVAASVQSSFLHSAFTSSQKCVPSAGKKVFAVTPKLPPQ